MIHFNIPSALREFAMLHRDERNIILHMVCLPLFILSAAFLFNSMLSAWGQSTTHLLCWSLLGMMTLCYTRFAGLLGLTSSLLMILIYIAGHVLSQLSSPLITLVAGFALLVIGYLLHRLGHWYEGNYRVLPLALSLFAAAPLYITARCLRQHPYFKRICLSLEQQAGPIYIRDMAN